MMGGNIEVTSTIGEGTSFIFQLSLKVAKPIESLLVSGENYSVIWKRKPFILLVDDNEINSEVSTRLLELYGCEAFQCFDGISALEAINENEFDMIFMDCQMPKMDGYETTRRIRNIDGPISKIPIVALTAHITVEDRTKCFTAGMDDYMGKPFRGEDLKLMLSRRLTNLVEGHAKTAEFQSKKSNPPQKEIVDQKLMDNDQRKAIHNLRNNLGIIMGNTEIALMYKEDPEIIEVQLKKILDAVNSAKNISSSI
jgi:CheY-like chemotaxis protein